MTLTIVSAVEQVTVPKRSPDAHQNTKEEDDAFAEVYLEFRSWPLFRFSPAWAKKQFALIRGEGGGSEPEPTEKVRVQIFTVSTTEADNDLDADASTRCSMGGAMRHIDTDYSPSYMQESSQLTFFGIPLVATHSRVVIDGNHSPPNHCGLQFVTSAPMCESSLPTGMAHPTPQLPMPVVHPYRSTPFDTADTAYEVPNLLLPTLLARNGYTTFNTGWCPTKIKQPKSKACLPLKTTTGPYVLAQDRAVAPHQDMAFDGGNCRKTSVLLQNLPDGFTRNMVMDVIRAQGLAKDVDFVYLPANFKTMKPYEYAFVNLSTPEAAEKFLEKLNGFSGWDLPNNGACEASWCACNQGLAGFIERYRNSRIMHASIDDEHKPAVYKNGVRTGFPRPTKIIRAPRLQKQEARYHQDSSKTCR
jgi:hypothetical protein